MIRAYAVDDVRRAERRLMAGLPEGELMRRAASGLATVLRRLDAVAERGGRRARVVVLVGSGDNGGDALFAAAAWVRSPGSHVRVHALCLPGPDGVRVDAAAAARACGVELVDAAEPRALGLLAGAAVVVDGILGIGGRPGLTGRAAELALAVPASAHVVAVDLPSGADPSGTVPVAGDTLVRADTTVTLGVAKPVHVLPATEGVVGRLHVVDIGLDLGDATPVVERWGPRDAAAAWPRPDRDADKYSRGVLGVVAGSDRYPGAAVLAATAAVCAGTGMVRYVGPPRASRAVVEALPEVVPGSGRVQAWALGPGIDPADTEDDGRRQVQAVRDALASTEPCLVDAGALDLLDVGTPRAAPTLLTPHAGELARLWSRVEGDASGEARTPQQVRERAPEALRAVAEATGAVVLLKGATTLIGTAGAGPLRSQAQGRPELATAGAGDVLSGLAGSLLAAGLGPLDAAAAAACVHGLASRAPGRGGAPRSAGPLARALPRTLDRLLSDTV